MKIDKETLVKERFWFLLPVIALFLLISWICVLGVRGETAKNYAEAKSQNDNLQKIATTPELKNNQWIEAMNKELGVSESKMKELWYTEYNRQNQAVREKDPLYGRLLNRLNPFIVWPTVTREKWEQVHPGQNMNELDFGRGLGNIPQDEFRQEYPQQYQAVAGVVRDWLDESNAGKIEGAVRVRGGGGNHRDAAYVNLIQPIPLVAGKLVLSEEAWTIEEDIAVKREIFQSLADLLDSYSRLKPEWAEVPFSEIKAEAAPVAGAPAVDGGAAPPPATAEQGAVNKPMVAPTGVDGGATANGHAAGQQPPAREVFQQVRYYNYIWPNWLDPQSLPPENRTTATIQFGLPAVDPYKGWRVDLTVAPDPRDERKLVLQAVSANHSDKLKLPAMPLAVWFSEVGNENKELPQPLILADAGGVDPCEYWPRGGLKRLSEKKLKDVAIPPGYGKIKRVSRVLPENTVDQIVCFNHDWLVWARLVQQPGRASNLNLVGDVINRSGRRMPGATFQAALTQANASTPLEQDFNVATDAFNAGERKQFFKEIRLPVPPKGLSYVSQKLTWRSSPIKRVERLDLGAVAHAESDRLKTLPLLAYDFKKKDPSAAALPGQAGTDAAGGAAGGDNSVNMGGFGGGKMKGGTSGNEMVSPNHNIRLDRYVQITPQLRRIPVALVMTVDATAMADIIGAMSNSRLRFQVTMAPWTRVAQLGRPIGRESTVAANPPAGGASTMAAAPALPPGTAAATRKLSAGAAGGAGGAAQSSRLNVPDDAVSSASGGAAGQAGRAGAPAVAGGQFGLEDDSSVVELQIYGIITIYESPDAQKKNAEGAVADNTQTGTTPPKQ